MNCMNYDISLDVSTEKEESRIHLLPMKIEATQAVNTEEYFDKQIVQTGTMNIYIYIYIYTYIYIYIIYRRKARGEHAGEATNRKYT